MGMLHYRRAIRFDEVDAAQIVFFGRYLDFCHEAHEAVFDAMDGGHALLFLERRIGFPAVHVEMDFAVPVRYGDVLDVRVTVPKIGTTSVTFRYEIVREADRKVCAVIQHVCVVTNMRTFAKMPVPEDVRAVLAAHHTP
jgi:4-hydroxybenzoyl-CoA thioesterase